VGRPSGITTMTKINDSVSVGAELAARITRMNEMLTLTDAEREAIEWALEEGVWSYGDPEDWTKAERLRAFLRGLLERTK
jgi:hypothetical protein